MKQQLTERLQKLKQEQEAGQKMLADLDARQLELHQTLLRISGAIQVIEELLANDSSADTEAQGVLESTTGTKTK